MSGSDTADLAGVAFRLRHMMHLAHSPEWSTAQPIDGSTRMVLEALGPAVAYAAERASADRGMVGQSFAYQAKHLGGPPSDIGTDTLHVAMAHIVDFLSRLEEVVACWRVASSLQQARGAVRSVGGDLKLGAGDCDCGDCREDRMAEREAEEEAEAVEAEATRH